jgi:hypothetical protein
MKKTITTIAALFMIVAAFAGTPNDKVLKIFNATFSSPQEVTWYDHETYYDVSFVQAGIRSNVKYDKEGNFLSSIRYYGEQNLPINIVCQLKKKYADKKIFGVTEITNADEVNYFVKLEDEKNWITVKVTGNGQMTSVEKYKKA